MAREVPSETASPRSSILARFGPGALVVCATVAAYLPALSGGFIWNDVDYVTAPALRSLRGLARIWTEPGATQQYYPLLHSAFWVQHRLWGDHALGYHVATLLLHACSAVLFALVLRRLFTDEAAGPGGPSKGAFPGAGWLAALVFALHPVHVESVAWISEQKNTLSLALYLGAALAYLRFDAARSPGAYGAALALFVFSLLCKTVTATLPAALLVVFWWKRGRLGWRRDVVPLLPWIALGAATGLFSSWVERAYVGAQGEDFTVPAVERALVAGRALWFYAGSLAWPFGLNFIYPRWTVDAAAWSQWLFPVAAVGAAAALWAMRRRSRGPLAAFLFFAGSLFPALGFVNLYGERYSWVWDHWQYLPDLGPIALGAAALAAGLRMAGPRLRWLGLSMAAALALALGALTWSHCAMFHDNETLYLATLARNPGSWMAHNNLGLAWSKVPGRLGDAAAQYEAALRLKPDIPETHTNLGLVWSQMPGRLGDAVAQYEEALRLKPDYSAAHFYLANALAQEGRVPEAIQHYEEALRIDPGMAEASNNLGMILCRTGRAREGMERIEAAIRMMPDFAQAHFARGAALLQAGRRDEAIAEYERVLQLRPGDPSALRMLELVRSRQ
ncbi:MAG: tetratricopeptide repeat protein [Opitutaceae bacterium]